MRKKNIDKNLVKIIPTMCGIIFLALPFLKVSASQFDFESVSKKIELNDGGAVFEIISDSQTVGDFLTGQKITLSPQDIVMPDRNEKIFFGSNVIILRAKKIMVKEGGITNVQYTFQNTVEQAIWENKKIKLDEDDVTVPTRTSTIKDSETIVVTHVLIKEEIKNLDIDYKTISNEDDSLGWRVKKVTQKGEKGIKEVKYKVVLNDGREISRKILESNITKSPSDEVVTQGTLVKVGKVHTGAASWYAFT